MKQSEFETFLLALENVESTENFGYLFYFVGDDHRLPFATIGQADNDFDKLSNLDREGVFRLNMGVRKDTFMQLELPSESDSDYTALNVFMPHPHYAKQNFICILNPAGENIARSKELLEEAHALATIRFKRSQNT